MSMAAAVQALWEFLARNWALVSIVGTVVLLIAVPAAVVRKYVIMALNILDDISPPAWPEMREAGRREGESVQFAGFDGHQLHGSLLAAAPDTRRRGMVVFAHEFGVDRWCCHRYVTPLRRAGYDVFAFDFRGHGESPPEPGYKPRQFPSDREQSDMLGAIAFVEDMLEQRGHPREVGLFGLSRGGGAALLAASGLDSVRAIAVDGAFSSDSVLEFHLKKWACIFAKLRIAYENHPPTVWRFLRWLIIREAGKKFGCGFPSVRKAFKGLSGTAVMFIHGQRDSYIPIEQAQMLYRLAGGPKYLWAVPEARHNQSVTQQPEEYARRLVQFFDRHLSGEPGGLAIDSKGLSDLAQPLEEPESPRRAPVREHASSSGGGSNKIAR